VVAWANGGYNALDDRDGLPILYDLQVVVVLGGGGSKPGISSRLPILGVFWAVLRAISGGFANFGDFWRVSWAISSGFAIFGAFWSVWRAI